MKAYQLFIIFIIVLLFLTSLFVVSIFVEHRYFKILKKKFPNINHKLYLALFWFMTIAIGLAFLTKNIMPSIINDMLMSMGMVWVVILPCMFIMEVFVLILDKKIKYKYDNKFVRCLLKLYNKGFLQLLIPSVIIICSMYNAYNIRLTKYDINIEKSSVLSDLKIVFLSDIHGQYNVTYKNKKGIANIVNSLNPDLVLIGGDMLDELINEGRIQSLSKNLSSISSKYGTYAVLGNHDFRAYDEKDKLSEFAKKSNINLIVDDYVEIEDIVIVGTSEKEGRSLVNNIEFDKSKPIILLEHIPLERGKESPQDVDLMLSGHTHNGQIFPSGIITEIMYENDNGLKVVDGVTTITSSGVGVWGPSIRLGSKGEICEINLKFNK